MVLPHPDLPIIKPLIPLDSRGWLHRLLNFSFQARFFTYIFYIYHFKIFPYIKNVLFKVSTCNRNWKYHNCYVQKWQTNETWPMHHMWKTKTQFIKRDVTGGSFLNILWWTNSLSKCIFQDITLLAREQNSIKAWIWMERQRSGAYR